MAKQDETSRFAHAPYTRPSSFKAKYSGSCYCSLIQYELSSDPLQAMYCHCETCQTLHGTPFQWAAVVPKDAVSFSPGSLANLVFFSASDEKDVWDDTVPVKLGCKQCHAPVADEGRNMMLMLPPFIKFDRDASGRKVVPDAFKATHHMFYGKRVMDVNDGLDKWVEKKGGKKCDDEGNAVEDE